MSNITNIQGTFKLNNGVEMPYLGLGTFEAGDGDEVKNSVLHAIDNGYRLIDTASFYKNEKGIGRALKETSVPRNKLFITTKVWNNEQGFDNTLRAYDKSLLRLGVDYVDLYLIHWPVSGKFTQTWKALEKIYNEGRVKAIGISNFLQIHIETLLQTATIVPALNQMEFHPYLMQSALREYCKQNNIVYQAWSPIMRGRIFEIDTLKQLANKYNKNEAQIVLRWDLQHGVATIPKSVHPDRIKNNADIFDFELTANDMAAIDSLDRNYRFGFDPMSF